MYSVTRESQPLVFTGQKMVFVFLSCRQNYKSQQGAMAAGEILDKGSAATYRKGEVLLCFVVGGSGDGCGSVSRSMARAVRW